MRQKGQRKYCPCCKKIVAQAVFEDHAERNRARVESDVAALAILGTDASPDPALVSNSSQESRPNPAPTASPEKARALLAGGPHTKAAPSPATPSLSPPPPPPPHAHTTNASQDQEARSFEIYKELRRMEKENERRYAALDSGSLRDLSDTFDPLNRRVLPPRRQLLERIKAEHSWMVERKSRIQAYRSTVDEGNKVLVDGIVLDLEKRLEKLEGVINPPCKRAVDTPIYDSSKYSSHPLHTMPPVTLIVLMMAVVLSLLSNMTRGPCNFILRMSRLAIQTVTNHPVSDIPGDIRTARKRFDLDPVVTVFAVCPVGCGKLYAPTSSQPFPVYPPTCTCGAKLTKPTGHHNGVAIRKPLKTYVMQDFTDHRARMYCRPGYEAIIRRENTLLAHKENDFVSDIRDARAYRDLKGPDGRPFIECATEIRSVWSLSYDGYNPGSNKAAGKAASVGSLAMACLSLPPCLRNRPENLYLVGLIPGPRQPAGDGLNPYIAPLVDHLIKAYHTGTFFSETYEHPEGITSREALLAVIADLPGARKLVGGASHSASVFCMYCHVPRDNKNNIDMSTGAWKLKTGAEFRKAAEDWRDAPTKAKRKELYKRNGVRWSELLRLDYWDPVRYTVIDGMHNLFLGLVGHHFKEVIGTHWDEKAVDAAPESPPKEKDLTRGRQLLDNGHATLSRLERLTRTALHQLCIERSASPIALPGKKLHKRQLAVALLMSSGIDDAMEDVQRPRTHTLEETVVPDIFHIDLGEGSTRPARRELLTTEELKVIQEDIKKTLRPWNHVSPPHDFGSPSHGKLKADEWRACIEFDLPISLAKLWGKEVPDEESGVHQEQLLALEATFLLAIGLRYATSHRTSSSHREKYTAYMLRYLRTVLELHPSDTLLPNHHNALHLPLFLELFGPIHGWWMFPYERLIGILQRHKTNFKFGELEETVIKTFCAAAHLKNVLDQSNPSTLGSPPTVLQQCLSIIQECLPDSVKGTMLQTSGSAFQTVASKEGREVLDDDIVASFTDGNLRGVPVDVFKRIQQNGRVFATKNTSRAHSIVFFRPNDEPTLRPGTIREIFEYDGTTYLVVHCHMEKHASIFDRYSDFGAEIWSQKLQVRPVVVPASPSVYCSYLREWDEDKFVLKPVIQDF